jgi:hypothetical protein
MRKLPCARLNVALMLLAAPKLGANDADQM